MNFLKTWFEKTEKQQSFALEILQRFLTTIREAVLIVAPDTKIIASNQKAYEAFARNNGALGGKRLSEVIRDLAVHQGFRKVLESKAPTEVKFETRSLEKRIFNLHISPFEFEDEMAAIGIFYDITQVEHLERVRQEFLSNVSHELRTPLTSILAFVETLEEGAIDDSKNNRRFLSVIHKNADRMSSLIEDISELSSIEAGKIRIEPKKLNLCSLVNEVFMNLSASAKETNINLINEVSANTFVFADVIRLEQILTNLITNAIKFNRPRGMVKVSSATSDKTDLINIADTGEGIASEHLQRIFERFFRADKARSREVGGTGLGLSIVKHLVRLHNGEISVASTIGKGTTFTIELPKIDFDKQKLTNV